MAAVRTLQAANPVSLGARSGTELVRVVPGVVVCPANGRGGLCKASSLLEWFGWITETAEVSFVSVLPIATTSGAFRSLDRGTSCSMIAAKEWKTSAKKQKHKRKREKRNISGKS